MTVFSWFREKPIWRLSVPLFCLLLLSACSRHYPPPPPRVIFEGLPVSGSLADVRHAGFTTCYPIGDNYHCRRTVTFEGQGPFVAAADFAGSDARGGFQKLVLWNDWDQDALFRVGDALKQRGWHECFTGKDRRGDNAIYTLPGETVTIAIELSYAGKRRLKLLPPWDATPRC